MEELEIIRKLLMLALSISFVEIGLLLRNTRNKLATSKIGNIKDLRSKIPQYAIKNAIKFTQNINDKEK